MAGDMIRITERPRKNARTFKETVCENVPQCSNPNHLLFVSSPLLISSPPLRLSTSPPSSPSPPLLLSPSHPFTLTLSPSQHLPSHLKPGVAFLVIRFPSVLFGRTMSSLALSQGKILLLFKNNDENDAITLFVREITWREEEVRAVQLTDLEKLPIKLKAGPAVADSIETAGQRRRQLSELEKYRSKIAESQKPFSLEFVEKGLCNKEPWAPPNDETARPKLVSTDMVTEIVLVAKNQKVVCCACCSLPFHSHFAVCVPFEPRVAS